MESPSPRWANSCALMAGILYCYGGVLWQSLATGQVESSNDLYQLSLYDAWNTSSTPWAKVQTVNQAPPRAYFALAALPDGASFLVHGSTELLVYNVEKNEWQTIHESPVERIRHTATADNQGRVWIWGGKSGSTANASEVLPSGLFTSQWTVLDTSTWTSTHLDIPSSPPPRVDHTATLVPDGNIIILGGLVYSRNITDPQGQYTLNPASMGSVLKFDMASSQWENVTATGNIPAPRGGHSSVLSSDGNTITVFGGSTLDDNGFALLNDVFTLELSTMRWSAPLISGPPPSPRRYHHAHLLSDQTMLVAFGQDASQQGTNDVHLLRLSDWTWISDYTPNQTALTNNPPSDISSRSSGGTGSSNTNYSSLEPSSNRTLANVSTTHTSLLQSTIPPPNDEQQQTEYHVKAGVIAGVVSGGVVAFAGALFLAVSTFLTRRRRRHLERSQTLQKPHSIQRLESKPDEATSL